MMDNEEEKLRQSAQIRWGVMTPWPSAYPKECPNTELKLAPLHNTRRSEGLVAWSPAAATRRDNNRPVRRARPKQPVRRARALFFYEVFF